MPNKKLKIIFMGTPEFAVLPLKALINDEDFLVQAIVTQEDKKIGRKQTLTSSPVKQVAIENNIPILQPRKIKDNTEFINLLKGFKPDFLVVVAYGKILPLEILNIPKYENINIHGSLLPKYRGASPIEEALLQGEKETGITFMRMEEGLDSGDIFLILRLKMTPEDNALTLRQKLSQLGAEQLPYILKDIAENDLQPIPQNHQKASYCHKIEKKDGQIDLNNLTAEQILNRIKAYTPWPSCYLLLKDKMLKILEAEIDLDSPEAKKTKPGEIVQIKKDAIAFGTKQGLLIPTKIQVEGKQAMDTKTFLLGNKNFLT